MRICARRGETEAVVERCCMNAGFVLLTSHRRCITAGFKDSRVQDFERSDIGKSLLTLESLAT
jgi:hypothetical protein